MSWQENKQIDRFEYPAAAEPSIPCRDLLGTNDLEQTGEERNGPAAADRKPVEHHDGHDFDAGRLQGIEEGRALEHQAQSAVQAAAEKQRVLELSGIMARFDAERTRFFEQAEQQVARLALAVAGRILRREAEADPLLLTGAVRVALGQLCDSTQVSLRVPATDLDLWTETISHLPNLRIRPEVIADHAMHTGDCAIETSMGAADLGIDAQLDELERCLFDTARTSISPLPSRTHHADASAEAHR